MTLTRDQFLARFPRASASVLRANGFEGPSAAPLAIEAAPRERRLRQSATKLNGLETDYQAVLHGEFGPDDVVAQAIRLRLANGIWYKSDFFIKSQRMFIECKGPHAFRGGFEFLKMAASVHTWAKFRLVWRVDGQWKFQDILP